MGSLELAGFILRSSYRVKVFSKIDKPIMPSKISKELEIRITHITRELRFLKEKGLVECINPKERVGRLYRLTTKGKKLRKELRRQKLID